MIEAIEQRVEFDATPERVWQALTDGSELAQWFPDGGAFDLEPGAGGDFVWAKHGAFAVQVETFEPPKYLAWRWVNEAGADVATAPTTLVEFRLTQRAGGGTILDLRESGFVSEKNRTENVGGWKHELAELVELLDA